MSSTIDINVPLCRYGDDVINKAYVQYVNISKGVVIMEGDVQYAFPPEVVGAWFSDVADSKGKVEVRK